MAESPIKKSFAPLRLPAGPADADLINQNLDRISQAIAELKTQFFLHYVQLPAGATPGPSSAGAPASAPYWLSQAVSTLPSAVDMGALGTGILQQTVAAGVSTPSILTMAATSVLARSTGTAGVPSALAASADGQVLNRAAGALTWSTLGAASVPALDATFITQTPNANLANEQALSALSSGVLSSVTATGVVSSTAFTTGRLAFGSGANGTLTESANLTFASGTLTANGGAATSLLNVGTTSAGQSGWITQFHRDVNGGAYGVVSNPNAGSSAQAGFVVTQSSTGAYGNNYLQVALQGVSYTAAGPTIPANSALYQHVNNTSAPMIFAEYGGGDVIFYTTTSYTERLRITNGGQILVGTTSPAAGVSMELVKTQNSGTTFLFVNESAGAAAYSSFEMGQSSTLASGASMGMYLFSSGSTYGSPYGVNIGLIQLSGGTSNMHFWIVQNTGDYVWWTKSTFPAPASSEKMRLTNNGVLSVPDLGAAGTGRLVKAAVTTGLLSIASASDVAGAITWPTDNQVLVSTGTTTAPDGNANFTYTGGSLIAGGTAQTVIGVSGTTPIITIDQLGSEPLNARVDASQTIASAAGRVFDGFKVVAQTLTLTGATNITTATGLNGSSFEVVTYNGNGTAKTIAEAATVSIAGAPLGTNGATITKAYAFWVQGGLSRFGGNGTHIFELPADATAGVDTTIDGRIPILVAGATKYVRYYAD